MPVVDYYRKDGKVVEIDSSPPADEVYSQVKAALDARLPSSHTLNAPAGAAPQTTAPVEGGAMLGAALT